MFIAVWNVYKQNKQVDKYSNIITGDTFMTTIQIAFHCRFNLLRPELFYGMHF